LAYTMRFSEPIGQVSKSAKNQSINLIAQHKS
jgi:hypothetical protein